MSDSRHGQARWRLRQCLKMALCQRRLIERWWGWAHVVIFLAFVVFLTSGLEMLATCLVADFRLSWIVGETWYAVICLVQTGFAWLTIMAIGLVATRRILTPKAVPSTPEAWFILALILIIMLSHIGLMAAQLAPGHASEWLASALPLSAWLGAHLTDAPAARTLFSSIHLFAMATFLVWIPRGKHLHILMAWPNWWWTHRGFDEDGHPIQTESLPDLEAFACAYEAALAEGGDEASLPVLGIERLGQTTQKMRLEAYSCSQCQRCTNVCPMTAGGIDISGGPMASMTFLRSLCEAGAGFRAHTRARAEQASLEPGLIPQEALWACVQCGACDRACPVGVEHMARIVARRRFEVAAQLQPPGLSPVFAHVERSGNPWGYPRKDRLSWYDDIKTPAQEPSSEHFSMSGMRRVLIFGGCMAAYDKAAQASLLGYTRWLSAMGFEVLCLKRETCCGEPMRKLGNEMGFQACAEENLAQIAATPHDIIITPCPHCAHTLQHAYAAFGTSLKMMHAAELMAHLWHRGILRFSPWQGERVMALHLPCYLSKMNDLSHEVVDMLKAVGIKSLQTGPSSRTHCCGGGGGQFFADASKPIATMRARELLALRAECLITLCPFCREMLGPAVQNYVSSPFPAILNVIDVLAVCADSAPANTSCKASR
ncbi:MAG: (Fe-S)-binding protein [Proteobacteria bacterium]|nr:(Fe-S)-binding protein [Pseudomonadota bacterium]